MNPSVFREYDIRGVANRDFDDGFVRALGRALGTRIRRATAGREGREGRETGPRSVPSIVVGRD
jgi:phosphomannomutase/phosphoglucomutase